MKALLVREVARRGDPKPQRSWLWLAGAVGGVGLVVGPAGHVESRLEIARALVENNALDAYASWPEMQVCPLRLAELNEYMNNKDAFGPWGGHYEMRCDETGSVVRASNELRSEL